MLNKILKKVIALHTLPKLTNLLSSPNSRSWRIRIRLCRTSGSLSNCCFFYCGNHISMSHFLKYFKNYFYPDPTIKIQFRPDPGPQHSRLSCCLPLSPSLSLLFESAVERELLLLRKIYFILKCYSSFSANVLDCVWVGGCVCVCVHCGGKICAHSAHDD